MSFLKKVTLETKQNSSLTYLGEVRNSKFENDSSLDSKPRDNAISVSWSHVEKVCMKKGWTIQKLAQEAGISRTTLHHWATGKTVTPQGTTVGKIAKALDVSVDSFFESNRSSSMQSPNQTARPAAQSALLEFDQEFFNHRREFDRSTNVLVDEIVAESPDLFSDWRLEQWDELYSCFGTGGHLSREGVLNTASEINCKQETLQLTEILLETHLKEAVKELIQSLYKTIDLQVISKDVHQEASDVETTLPNQAKQAGHIRK